MLNCEVQVAVLDEKNSGNCLIEPVFLVHEFVGNQHSRCVDVTQNEQPGHDIEDRKGSDGSDFGEEYEDVNRDHKVEHQSVALVVFELMNLLECGVLPIFSTYLV